jgi:transcriptional regulator with XRE-family HTH domain
MLTQDELGKKAGLSGYTISRIESDQVAPRVSTIRKIAGALGIEPEELAAHPKTRAPLPRDDGAGPTDKSLLYLRAFRSFLWTVALEWAEQPPQSRRETAPLLAAVATLVNGGAFEDEDADTAARGELSLLRLALAKLAEISGAVESDEVAAEIRGTLALVPDLQDQNVA